jgi:hypothetical protein
LNEQKTRLEQDMSNVDAVVEQHIEQMRNDSAELGRMRRAMGGGFGGGGGGLAPTLRSQPAAPATQRSEK